MKLRLFRSLWGCEGGLPAALERLAADGFDGVEGPAPESDMERRDFLLDLEQTPWIAEICTCTREGEYVPEPGLSPGEHLESLRRKLDQCLDGDPLFVTTMGGWDGWSLGEGIEFLEGVLRLEEEAGLAIAVETHRGRWSFSPWNVRETIDRLPEVRWTCDFSHWCVVCERLLLDEQPELLARMAQVFHHIHARVGYAQGPQVPDPRDPEHAGDLEAHVRWWRRLWQGARERGRSEVTMTPEFGPDGYLHHLPGGGGPVADLKELNRWMAARLRDEWNLIP